ncbi:MAG TPA: dihydropteroate synthase, partial [Thermomicrobiales bacterium]
MTLAPTVWGEWRLEWGGKTFVMAIVNATPDSFSGDGVAGDPEAAARYAAAAQEAGADIIDIGAESTRPGHTPVTAEEELERLLPVLTAVRERVSLPISVDTNKAVVADAALRAGANLINDIRGFVRDPELASVAAAHGVPAILMHDVPPEPGVDLVASVLRELSRRLDRALAAGIPWDHLIIDPGFGFGKDWRQNLELLRRLDELRTLGRPILVGFSRKSTIGRVLGLGERDRL